MSRFLLLSSIEQRSILNQFTAVCDKSTISRLCRSLPFASCFEAGEIWARRCRPDSFQVPFVTQRPVAAIVWKESRMPYLRFAFLRLRSEASSGETLGANELSIGSLGFWTFMTNWLRRRALLVLRGISLFISRVLSAESEWEIASRVLQIFINCCLEDFDICGKRIFIEEVFSGFTLFNASRLWLWPWALIALNLTSLVNF